MGIKNVIIEHKDCRALIGPDLTNLVQWVYIFDLKKSLIFLLKNIFYIHITDIKDRPSFNNRIPEEIWTKIIDMLLESSFYVESDYPGVGNSELQA